MTEVDWLAANDPFKMLNPFPGKWDHRKLWLFGCACARRAWNLLPDHRTRACIEAAEAVVDGRIQVAEVDKAWAEFDAAIRADELVDYRSIDTYEIIRNLLGFVDPAASLQVAREIAEGVGSSAVTLEGEWSEAKTEAWRAAEMAERASQALLLRDIFGNPFRPPVFKLDWRTANVQLRAKDIYERRAFDGLPILMDALVEAGCDNEELLAHCCDPKSHVRGCWAIDLLLGKD